MIGSLRAQTVDRLMSRGHTDTQKTHAYQGFLYHRYEVVRKRLWLRLHPHPGLQHLVVTQHPFEYIGLPQRSQHVRDVAIQVQTIALGDHHAEPRISSFLDISRTDGRVY